MSKFDKKIQVLAENIELEDTPENRLEAAKKGEKALQDLYNRNRWRKREPWERTSKYKPSQIEVPSSKYVPHGGPLAPEYIGGKDSTEQILPGTALKDIKRQIGRFAADEEDYTASSDLGNIAQKLRSGEIEPVLGYPWIDKDTGEPLENQEGLSKEIMEETPEENIEAWKEIFAKSPTDMFSVMDQEIMEMFDADPAKASGLPTLNYATMCGAIGKCYATNTPLIIYGEPGLGKTAVVVDTSKQISLEIGKRFFPFTDLNKPSQKYFYLPIHYNTVGAEGASEVEAVNDAFKKEKMDWNSTEKGTAYYQDISRILQHSFMFYFIKIGTQGEEALTGIPRIGNNAVLDRVYEPWVYATLIPPTPKDVNGDTIDGIIFLDELIQGKGEIQNALMALFDEISKDATRRIGNMPIMRGYRIIGCSNYTSLYEPGGWLKPQVAARSAQYVLVLDPAAWLSWVTKKGYLHPELLAFFNWHWGNGEDKELMNIWLRLFFREPDLIGTDDEHPDPEFKETDIARVRGKDAASRDIQMGGADTLAKANASPRQILKFNKIFKVIREEMEKKRNYITRGEMTPEQALGGIFKQIEKACEGTVGRNFAKVFMKWYKERYSVTEKNILTSTTMESGIYQTTVVDIIITSIRSFIEKYKIYENRDDIRNKKGYWIPEVLSKEKFKKDFCNIIALMYKIWVPNAITLATQGSPMAGGAAEIEKFVESRTKYNTEFGGIQTNRYVTFIGDLGNIRMGVSEICKRAGELEFPSTINFVNNSNITAPANISDALGAIIGVASLVAAQTNNAATTAFQQEWNRESVEYSKYDSAAIYLDAVLSDNKILSESQKNILAHDAKYSYLYAKNILKDRFIEGEYIINENVEYSNKYKQFVDAMPIKCAFNTLYEKHLSDIKGIPPTNISYGGNEETVQVGRLIGAITDKYKIENSEDFCTLITKASLDNKEFERFKTEILGLANSIASGKMITKLKNIIGGAKNVVEIFLPLKFFYILLEENGELGE